MAKSWFESNLFSSRTQVFISHCNKKEAENLLKLVINHSKKLCNNIEKEMEKAKFPLFKGD